MLVAVGTNIGRVKSNLLVRWVKIIYTFLTVNLQTNKYCFQKQQRPNHAWGCFITCNVYLADNSEVGFELQCFIAELITYIVMSCLYSTSVQSWIKSMETICSSHKSLYGTGTFHCTRTTRLGEPPPVSFYLGVGEVWWMSRGVGNHAFSLDSENADSKDD